MCLCMHLTLNLAQLNLDPTSSLISSANVLIASTSIMVGPGTDKINFLSRSVTISDSILKQYCHHPVSYTHLTLPTIYSV